MDSFEYQPKETLFVVETDDNLQCKKYKCLLCDRFLSSKQRVLSHLHTAHDRSPLKRVKKRYLNDPGLPIPRRTLYRKEAQGKKSVEQETDESSTGDEEKQHAVVLDVNEEVVAPDPVQDHYDSSQDDSEMEEELTQNENGGPEDVISRNINTYCSVNSEEVNCESDSESNDSPNSNTESSSESEVSEASSSEDENDEE